MGHANARQVAWTFAERAEPVRFMIRDHNRKFSGGFDAVFEADGVRIVRTPIQAPEAKGSPSGSFAPSIRMPGLAVDSERSASGTRAHGLNRPLRRLASSSQP